MPKVLGFFHLKLNPGVDTKALEKFLLEEAFPYWEQLPGLKCHLVKGREGTMLQEGEFYWVNEAETEERYQGFLPTPDRQWQAHFDAGLKMHGEIWNSFMADFVYQGSIHVLPRNDED